MSEWSTAVLAYNKQNIIIPWCGCQHSYCYSIFLGVNGPLIMEKNNILTDRANIQEKLEKSMNICNHPEQPSNLESSINHA